MKSLPGLALVVGTGACRGGEKGRVRGVTVASAHPGTTWCVIDM